MTAAAHTLVIGLAGHVDHGKTSLVRALTGTDTDRLEEERRRGLTIELGFAHAELPGGVVASFIDVPGHERFVRTMASGVSGIDAAMLVVDAREGVRAQTREHAEILRLLDVERVIAVITKTDLVDDSRVHAVGQEVGTLLGGSMRTCVACSAQSGEGMGRLHAALAQLPVRERDESLAEPFRMPIDRVFSKRGVGLVVTGTVWRGFARVGDTLECTDANTPARVRGLQTRGESVESVHAGQRAAVNIAIDGPEPTRGDDLISPDSLRTSRRLTVTIELLRSCEQPIRSGKRVLLMLGARAIHASVKLLDKRSLEAGGWAIAQLILNTPVIATGAQPFLLRSGSPETTIGGGSVLSVFAPGLSRSNEEWIDHLRTLEHAAAATRIDGAAWSLGERSWPAQMALQEAGAWNVMSPGVEFASGRIDPRRLEALTARVLARVERLSDGGTVARSRVISTLRRRAEIDVHAAIDRLIALGSLIETPSGVSLPDDRASVSDEDSAAIDEIARVYASYGAAPPPVDDIAPAVRVRLKEARRLVRLASERKVLEHVSGPFYLASTVADDIRLRVRDLLHERGSVTVSDVREMLGVTRKHAVPICEYLDRVRVTRRIGNQRVRFEREHAEGMVPGE